MVPENIKEIARKFLRGNATEEEMAQLHQWYDAWVDEETIVQADTEDPDVIEARMLSRLLEQIRQKTAEPAPVVGLPRRRWWKVAVAAAVVLALGVGGFYWLQRSAGPAGQEGLAVTDTSGIRPGIDKALLILADGRQVVLDSTATGIVSKQGNTTIINLDGQLTYEGANGGKETNTYYNTIQTGRGNQYQLVLPDGTRAWLNAASSIRFPTVFAGNERNVHITGEVYFEVAKHAQRPFRVAVNDRAEVEVLGTHFNINAYEDEDAIRTTLLEGKVSVKSEVGSRKSDPNSQSPGFSPSSSVFLKPGEQAVVAPHSPLAIHHSPDLDQVMAWKNGYFQFTDAPVTTVMRQVSRWYDVEVGYQGNVQQEVFSGSIPRSASIAQLIKILELTKTIKIHIEGRKLIAAPY